MIRFAERWPLSPRMKRLILGAAGAGILALLWAIWTSTSSAKAGLCPVINGSPATSFPYPSQVFVLTAIGAYVCGHITSRYVVEVRPRLVGLLGAGQFGADRFVVVVKLIVTGSLLIATLLNVYEGIAFGSGQWPITYYVWCATAASPQLALLGAAVASFLVGRWLWVAS